MPLSKDNIVMIVGAVVVTLLQLIVSPYLTIGYASANFIAAYVIVVAVVRPSSGRVTVMAFILGMLYNLFLGGPLGAMAFALVLAAHMAGTVMSNLDNGTTFMPLMISAFALFALELVYSFFMVMSAGLGLVDALMFRAAPCFIFDVIIGAVFYVIMSKLASEPDDTVSLGGPTLLR